MEIAMRESGPAESTVLQALVDAGYKPITKQNMVRARISQQVPSTTESNPTRIGANTDELPNSEPIATLKTEPNCQDPMDQGKCESSGTPNDFKLGQLVSDTFSENFANGWILNLGVGSTAFAMNWTNIGAGKTGNLKNLRNGLPSRNWRERIHLIPGGTDGQSPNGYSLGDVTEPGHPQPFKALTQPRSAFTNQFNEAATRDFQRELKMRRGTAAAEMGTFLLAEAAIAGIDQLIERDKVSPITSDVKAFGPLLMTMTGKQGSFIGRYGPYVGAALWVGSYALSREFLDEKTDRQSSSDD